MAAQQNTKTRRATTGYIASNLVGFLAMIEERSKNRLNKEIFIFVKNIVLTKNQFIVSVFHEFPEHHMEK